MSRIRSRLLLVVLVSVVVFPTVSRATVLLEYNAAGGTTPDASGWTQFGFPMFNPGDRLVQDLTFDAEQQSSEYLSPTLAVGTFTRGGAAYGIEFRVRPVTDVNFVGPAWPELYLTWSDNEFNYNVTIDKFGGATTSGNGDVVYGRNSFSPAITGIDWSVPHTIFIGHRGSAGPSSVFDFYLDGTLISTVVDGSIARVGSYARDAIGFGDGTTGNQDVAAEWYFVRVHDVNAPAPVPEPAAIALAALGGLSLLRRSRRRRA